MKTLGYLLITAGFVTATLSTMLEVAETPDPKGFVDWGVFLVGMVACVVGIAIVRLIDRKHATSEDRLDTHIVDVVESLDALVDVAEDLKSRRDEVDVYDLRHEIDRLFPEHLDRFVEAREAIGHVYGLQAYADVMSHFASGERAMNRTWVTSADGYITEAHKALDTTVLRFGEARAMLSKVRDQA